MQIRPAPTSLSFQPGVLTVSPAGASGPAVGVGEHGALRYELIAGSASGLVSIEGLNVSAGPGLTALVEDLLREGGKPPEPFDVQVGWKAYYDGGVSGWGVEVASGTATLKVRVEVSSKVKAEAEAGSCCDCAEGTETKVDAGCVSFRQAFGRTPLLAGMPVGALAIEEEVFDEALFTPAALRYDHPMMRRLDPETRLVTTPMGWTIAYGADGFPIDTDVALDSRLEEVASETQEVFADRSRVAYDAAGKVSALISPRGVRVPVDELGISVERDAAGNIARVESVADGTLEVAVTSPTAYTVSWTNAEGAGRSPSRLRKRGRTRCS